MYYNSSGIYNMSTDRRGWASDRGYQTLLLQNFSAYWRKWKLCKIQIITDIYFFGFWWEFLLKTCVSLFKLKFLCSHETKFFICLEWEFGFFASSYRLQWWHQKMSLKGKFALSFASLTSDWQIYGFGYGIRLSRKERNCHMDLQTSFSGICVHNQCT